MFTLVFWKAALERAVKTFAQTGVAVIGVNYADLASLDWQAGLTACAVATVLSLLTSIGSNAATGDGPSLANEVAVEPPQHRAES